MSDKSYYEEAQDFLSNVNNSIIRFLEEHDSESWWAFGAFFAVITFGMFMNYDAFHLIIGVIPALIVSLFFEYAILAWKITSDRKRNDKKQNQLSNTATWISVIAAAIMIVVNLFRVGGSENFESTAYIIVGIAALTQVVFYLLFTQADPDKQITREHGQQKRNLSRREQYSRNVIGELKSDMDIVRFITQELVKIQEETRDLPLAVRENLLESARQKLLAQFAKGKDDVEKITAPLADLNRDGVIGQPTKVNYGPGHPADAIAHYAPVDLEEIKKLPVDTLFEDESPTEMPIQPTIANDMPTEVQEKLETDF